VKLRNVMTKLLFVKQYILRDTIYVVGFLLQRNVNRKKVNTEALFDDNHKLEYNKVWESN
jgi:hypothetical protein